MNMILSIALGGATGAVLRHYSSTAWARVMGDSFPYGTLFVNVLGSLLIGVLMETMALKWQVSLETRAFLITGMLGGFTTFSAFSLDTFKLVETGHTAQAAVYVLASMTLSIGAIFGGVFLVRQMVT